MALVEAPQSLDTYAERVRSILPRLACFDAADYLALHTDLAAIDPYRHFSEHGVWEGRSCITPERLTAKLSRATALATLPALDVDVLERAYRAALSTSAIIHLPAKPSAPERRIAERLTAALVAVGVDVPIHEGAPAPGTVGAIIIHPERQFTGERDGLDLGCLSTALVVVSGSPDQADFRERLPYLLGAAGVLAMESETYVLCQDAGIPVVWLGALPDAAPELRQPTNHPLYYGLGRAVRAASVPHAWRDRPIDVLAIEAASPARAAAWARMAEGLTRCKCVVYQPPADEAVNGEEEGVLRRYLYARSKIVLHLHASAPSALSSALVAEVAAAGAVIVSEPASPHLLLKPERHYFEASARRMPTLIDRLMSEEEGTERVAAAIGASQRALAEVFDLEVIGLAMVDLLSQAKGATHE